MSASRGVGGRAGRMRGLVWPLVIVVVLILVGVAAVLTPRDDARPGDPDSTGPAGAAAVARVLAAQKHTQVEPVRSVAELRAARVDSDTTLLVVGSAELSEASAAAVAAKAPLAGRLVLLAPDNAALDKLGVPARLSPEPRIEESAKCSSDDVAHDDRLPLGSRAYVVESGVRAQACFPVAAAEEPLSAKGAGPDGSARVALGARQAALASGLGSEAREPASPVVFRSEATGPRAAALATAASGGHARTAAHAGDVQPAAGTPSGVAGAFVEIAPSPELPVSVFLLGTPDLLSNAAITSRDNAGIAVRTLAHQRRLVWFVPPVDDTPMAAKSTPVPPWFVPGVAVLGLAALTLCLWRGRRLGRLVREPLPAVVHAVETTQARGRLYRQAKDPAHAWDIVRDAALARWRRRVSLPTDAPTEHVAAAVAEATGRTRDDVAHLLTTTPANDAEFARASTELRRIDREVHTG